MCISSFLVVCFAQFFQIFLDGADGRNPHVTIFVFALSVTHPKKIGAEEREREREGGDGIDPPMYSNATCHHDWRRE